MEPADVAALARIWADSVPLSMFVEDRLKQLPDEPAPVGVDVACAVTQPATKKKRTSSRALSSVETLTVSLANMSAAMAVGRKQSERFERVKVATMNDLIAGRLACIGRPAQSYAFKKIDASFWIGASVQWYGNAVSRGGDELIEVRVITSPVPVQIQTGQAKGPGRPSKASVIREAIAEYAKGDPNLNRPPLERRRHYRSYISSRGYDPHKDAGFDEKTIQKYEREFRRSLS